jgi:dTDP-4-dehydrorhamnose reductase
VERYLETELDRFLLFRTSKLMSKTPHPRNILAPLIRSLSEGKAARCFVDQWINPVFVEDIAEALTRAMAKELKGTFHLGTRRIFSRMDLGLLLAASLKLDAKLVQPIRIADVKPSEPRSHHDTILCSKIEEALGLRFTEIEDAIPDLRKLV